MSHEGGEGVHAVVGNYEIQLLVSIEVGGGDGGRAHAGGNLWLDGEDECMPDTLAAETIAAGAVVVDKVKSNPSTSFGFNASDSMLRIQGRG